MFSSLFGKRRSSPVENETPPIPGATSEDSFVLVDPASPSPARGGIYPSVSGGPVPYPQRPAPPAPVPRATPDQTFHYLQGVPFKMSSDLQMASNKDAFATQISDLLAFLTNKVNLDGYNYDFSAEKSVLKEY